MKKYPHLSNAGEMPPFPAKTWMTPTDDTWRQRCTVFNAYFSFVFSHPKLCTDPLVLKMFERTEEAEDWTPSLDFPDLTEEEEEERYRFLDISDKMKIGYIDRGESDKPLVLFVHGFPGMNDKVSLFRSDDSLRYSVVF